MAQKPNTEDFYTARPVEGVYRIADTKDRETGEPKKSPLVEVTMEITEGECAGWVDCWTGWLNSDLVKPKTQEKLMLLGWDGNLRPMGFAGNTVRIRFEQKGDYLDVSGIWENKGGGGGGPRPLESNASDNEVRDMEAELRASMGLPPKSAVQAPPKPAQRGYGASPASTGQRPAAPQQPREQPPIPGAQHPRGVPQGRGAAPAGYGGPAQQREAQRAYQGGEERLERGHGNYGPPRSPDDDIPF